jgi:hypothetical protein
MTQDEIDTMWQQAMRQSIEEGEMFTRYKFAKLVAAKKQERIIEVVERLGTWAHITEVVAEIRGEA